MASTTTATATITLPKGFQLQSVDEKLTPKPEGRAAQAVLATAPPKPSLGVLSNFTGTFVGNGFNTIWRPSSGTQKFANPVPAGAGGSTTPAPNPPNESILELNLTSEELAFTKSLGNVPNRGLREQKDITLSGVSYIQTVRDVTNINTGKGDGTAQEIHFEPGLWMHVPATNLDGESLSRMGSIPHGTTINAQCPAPTTTTPKGGPRVEDKVDITPFRFGHPEARLTGVFPAMTVVNKNTARLPQDLDKFNSQKTITQDIINNPILVLVNANKGKNILKTTTFTVSTAPSFATASDSDGISNIAFLEGRSVSATEGSATLLNAAKNADAALMTAQFWVSTVQHEIVVPKFQLGEPPLRITAPAPNPGAAVPTFVVSPPREITEPKKILVTSTQIQYSQVVNLDFFTLTWPHVSVATLVPAGDITVPDSAFN
jgi:hypothetical protein